MLFLFFIIPQLYRNAVYFHMLLNGDDQKTAAFEEPRLHEIEPVWVDSNVYIGCLYCKLSGAGDGRDKDSRIFPGRPLIDLIKTLKTFWFDSAFF